MNVIRTKFAGVLLLEPRIFRDERGFVFESYNRKALQESIGLDPDFVQDNHSRSAQGVIRGLHYQLRRPQSKLVRVVAGSVFDVVVDIRRSSPTFGQWHGCELSAENKRMLWIPAGYAHGFASLSDGTECLYKVTDYWTPADARTIVWNDPRIGIEWPAIARPIVSENDRAGVSFEHAEVYD